MEARTLSQVFRQLFSHDTCSRLRYPRHAAARVQRRAFSDSRSYAKPKSGDQSYNIDSEWQQRNDMYPQDRSKEFQKYPLVTADSLRSWKNRPRKVKMLTRDFIEDSLYNPNYGYFSKQAIIFNPGEPFNFNTMRNEAEFHTRLGQRYTQFEDGLDSTFLDETRQLWHTPTELFRPYYGEAIARYLVENYKLTHHPYHDLIIYEIGAGNGTLMLNILDHIRDMYPEVYIHTQFKIIEISPSLASLQASQLTRTAESRGHAEHVQILNTSIFDWTAPVPEPCWFLALEVFDNFAHDCIRYSPSTSETLQSSVLIDGNGEFFEFYSPALDPLAERFLRVRDTAVSYKNAMQAFSKHPLGPSSPAWRRLRANLPFAPNLSEAEYIPTRLLQFFEKLDECFPLHRLLTSDFHFLPDTIRGYNAPVVQTRYKRRVVPVRTPFVHQGFFDILFPTDFPVVEDVYRAVTGKFTRLLSHEDFLKRWAYVEDTRTMSGENPMLGWYKNATVMLTV